MACRPPSSTARCCCATTSRPATCRASSSAGSATRSAMTAASGSYDSLLAELAIPHRAKAAYRQLLNAGPEALPAMRCGLRHTNAYVRYWCCQYLDRFLEPEVLGDLVSMLDDPDYRIRVS